MGYRAMNFARTFALVIAAGLALAAPANAQWQTPIHSVPVGQGGGNIGFNNAVPGTAGQPLVSNGASADPSFQAVPSAGIAAGAVDNTKLANPSTVVNGQTCTLGSTCVGSGPGPWRISNNAAANDAVFPDVKVNMSADFVTLYSPSLGLTHAVNGPVTASSQTNCGPAVNCRDSGVSATVTMTVASPAVVTWTAHGLTAGQAVLFNTTGTLLTGVNAGQVYYVIAAGLTADTFEFSTTIGGSAVNSSGTQSGTQTGTKNVFGMGDTVWFYYIWGSGPGLGTISSKSAPNVGPALPTGYTHYAPSFVTLMGSDGTLRPSCGLCGTKTTWHVIGETMWLDSAIVVSYTSVAVNAAPTTLDLSTYYPLGTSSILMHIDAEAHNGAAQLIGGFVMGWAASGQNDINLSLYVPVNSFVTAMETAAEMPLLPARNVWAVFLSSAGTIASTDLTLFYRGWRWNR